MIVPVPTPLSELSSSDGGVVGLGEEDAATVTTLVMRSPAEFVPTVPTTVLF